MITLKAAKRNFFDRPRVLNALAKAQLRALSKAGAFVRRRARSSMRRSPAYSRPGRPPHAHVGLLKTMLFFSYDRSRESVVIGPVALSRSSDVPPLLEFGGRVTARRDRWATTKSAITSDSPIVRRRAQRASDRRRPVTLVARAGDQLVYAPRPFMGPALVAEVEAGTIPRQWAGEVRGGL